MADDFLSHFHDLNVVRCNEKYFGIDSWSETDWGCAAAGEMGELCDLLKKRRRGQDIPLEAVGKEIADVVTYLDLLCAKLGLSLQDVVTKKFNEVSARCGFPILL